MTSSGELATVNEKPFSEAKSLFLNLVENSSGLTFLLGAGCSKCAGLPLTSELTQKVLESSKLESPSKDILTAVAEEFEDTAVSNIEDYLSEIVDLLAITDRRSDRGVTENTVFVGKTSYSAEQLRKASDQIKLAIADAIDRKVPVDIHQRFVSSVHRPIRVGRQAPSQPVDYVILNYDTILEGALAMESILYADGLRGGATAWWDANTFDAPGLSARVIKIHGSIDWSQFQDNRMPRRIGSNIKLENHEYIPLLIWPSSTKYQEAQLDPFAQLLERARIAVRPNGGRQRLLVICGYSFGDRHINSEIEKALRESEGNLTIAGFTDSDEPTGPLKEWHEDSSIREQVLIFAKRGYFHADSKETSDDDLNWWKFENLTNILNGDV